jgi:formylglycine-generating enzyme required for sulfatase activity
LSSAVDPAPRPHLPPASTKERDGYLTTSPVASYPKGETLLGIQDLLGNVWELTCTVDYGTPNLAPKARAPIARRSSWASGDDLGFRAQFSPAKGFPEVGFRCARDARNAEK